MTEIPIPPNIEQQRPGRALAVIVRTTTREKGYIFARNIVSDEEYFLHLSGMTPQLWTNLQDGDAITCRVSETSKGLRGHDVERATLAEEQAAVAAAEEQRGNR